MADLYRRTLLGGGVVIVASEGGTPGTGYAKVPLPLWDEVRDFIRDRRTPTSEGGRDVAQDADQMHGSEGGERETLGLLDAGLDELVYHIRACRGEAVGGGIIGWVEGWADRRAQEIEALRAALTGGQKGGERDACDHRWGLVPLPVCIRCRSVKVTVSTEVGTPITVQPEEESDG